MLSRPETTRRTQLQGAKIDIKGKQDDSYCKVAVGIFSRGNCDSATGQTNLEKLK